MAAQWLNEVRFPHGMFEKHTPAILQFLQFDHEGEDFKDDEPQISPNREELSEKMDSIEREFSKSGGMEDDIAQIAILHTPIFDPTEILDLQTETHEDDCLKWLQKIPSNVRFRDWKIYDIMKEEGILTEEECQSQLLIAVEYGLLIEVSRGLYEAQNSY